VKIAIEFCSALSLKTYGVAQAVPRGRARLRRWRAGEPRFDATEVVDGEHRGGSEDNAAAPRHVEHPNPPPRLSAMNGTGTLWVTSITESIFPGLPQ
jgi:hypothetical protein